MTPQRIYHLLGGQLIGKPRAKTLIVETLAVLPMEMLQDLLPKLWIISTPQDVWAMTFKGVDHKKDHLIFLSDELFEQGEERIKYTILHEIGHVLLGYENSINRTQTQSEIQKQERQADQFAKKYLS